MNGVLDVLEAKLKAEVVRYTENICGGSGIVDYATYKENCGVIRGLTLALDEVASLAKNQREIDDEPTGAGDAVRQRNFY